MRQLWTITASDLRQRVRDRSVLIFGLVVPLALMGVFNLLYSGVDESSELDPVTVAASVPTDDRLASTVVEALGGLDAMEVTVEQVPAGQVRNAAETGDADLGMAIPDGFGEQVRSGDAVTVELVQAGGAGVETDVVISVIQRTVDRLAAGAETAMAAGRAGLSSDQLATIAQQAATAGPEIALTEGEASDEQLTMQGSLVAGQAGLFLLFTVGFGVLALLSEREVGTMARLQAMPMRQGTIVSAKAFTGFLLGLVATSVLLGIGSLLFGVRFGSLPAVAVLVICAVTAATSLTFVVARLARTAEQANVAQSILAIVLGMSGGAFFPIDATGAAASLLDLNPIAALIRGLGITSGGGGIADIGTPVVIMLGFAVVTLALSRVVPDRGASA